ncbi:MAG: XRE family transcriptional regulator [Lachnospiraceae bacterium]|uniref:LexA family protein n=1 Tax=Galactobacillus timonensis TaxID=2041840 RepID=UPI002A9E3E1C|nr:XRE family transcriptional regulator [Lachnospiraceae bacterium]
MAGGNMPLKLYENIRALRKARKMSQEELASRTGYTDRSSIARIEAGDIDLSQSKIQLFADVFGVTPTQLMGDLPGQAVRSVSVPIYAPICCGNGGFVDDNILDYIALPSAWLSASKEYFAQTAHGDSMEGAGIYDGDVLVFEKSGTPQQGRVGCFCIDDNDAMCKKYRVAGDGRIYLMPANPNYDPIPVDPEMEHFRCLGLLAFVISDRRSE